MKALFASLALGAALLVPAFASAETSPAAALDVAGARFALVDAAGNTVATLVIVNADEHRLRTIAATIVPSIPKAQPAPLRLTILTPQQEEEAARRAYEQTFAIERSP